MKLAIMQPYLFPYLGYFQLIAAVDRFVVYDDVGYIKQGWINRNRLLINGEPGYLTVPLKHATGSTLIKDVITDDDSRTRWRQKLAKIVGNTYRRAPFFAKVFPLVEHVLALPTDSIADIARASLVQVCRYLGVTTELIQSSITYNNQHLKGEERVLDICAAEAADQYINVIGGRELYSVARFRARGVTLNFLKTAPVEYRQFHEPFVPSLSMIDVLMFNSPKTGCDLLTRYELI